MSYAPDTTSSTLGCAPYAPGTFTGAIALIDRGTCGFAIKVKNAQDAGALAVIIADNVAGSPPPGLGGADATVTIPAVRITLADANEIKAQLASTVSVALALDLTVTSTSSRIPRTTASPWAMQISSYRRRLRRGCLRRRRRR
ncbi:MAG TPA: PA domain-containing protein [Kofleriaceae bacterium]|nr:PA domain-containing protein [Kofleriaceae bacterium]